MRHAATAAVATRSRRNLYDAARPASCPSKRCVASLGCGNPTALAELRPGETVLDLGSGGGIDVLLSARARRADRQGVRPRHDRRDARARAREPAQGRRSTNVEFLKGEIEHIPLPDNSVDVIISNCVINLSADKDAVLREAFRVLKPGGRFAVSDVVVRGDVPPSARSMELWVGCVAGALEEARVPREARRRRFRATSTSSRRASTRSRTRARSSPRRDGWRWLAEEVDGRFMSAFIRATKPAAVLRAELLPVIRWPTETRYRVRRHVGLGRAGLVGSRQRRPLSRRVDASFTPLLNVVDTLVLSEGRRAFSDKERA